MLGSENRKQESKMAARENRTKEGPRTWVRTSGRTNSILASLIYIGLAQGRNKAYKKVDKRPGVSLLCTRYIHSFSLSFSSFHVFGLSCPHSWGEKAMAPHSSTLAWKIPWAEEPGGLQSMGSLRVRYNWATSLSLFTFMPWRRKWQPTPVFLPGESQGRGSLVGCRLWGRTGSDTTKVT